MRIREENPFEKEEIAKEWIESVEGEKKSFRDKEIYPRLIKWISKVQPKTLVEIGSGQGICSNNLGKYQNEYIGIEPSKTLIKRANELYGCKPNVKFIMGDAYQLPLDDKSSDAIFSINVWFHLKDLIKASQEINRVLKKNGNLFIITANPNAYPIWESLFFEYKIDGKKIEGKFKLPVISLSKSIFYLHSIKKIKNALNDNGILINSIEYFATIEEYDSYSFLHKKDERFNSNLFYFISIEAIKKE